MERYATCGNCGGQVFVGDKGARCWECDGSSPSRVDELTNAIKRTLEGAVPYLSKHGAYMIRQSDWVALANLVDDSKKGLTDAGRKG